jgi:hypothetical protein
MAFEEVLTSVPGDTTNDPTGCIFTQNLLIPDATAGEIDAAVSSGGAAATTTAAVETLAAVCPAAASTPPGSSASTAAVAATTSSDNLQTFNGALGGAAADAITFSGDNTRPFEVNGNTFVNFAAAAQRTCDIQFNACANMANAGAVFSVSDCQTQKTQCDAAQAAASVTSFSSGAATATGTTADSGAISVSATAAPTADTAATASATASVSSTLDFGACTGANPDIVFGPGFDGRTESAFEPVDETDFNHGSADNIGVITSFICQQLQDKCKASATTLATCASAKAAAAAASGQAAADAWNAAFAA